MKIVFNYKVPVILGMPTVKTGEAASSLEQD